MAKHVYKNNMMPNDAGKALRRRFRELAQPLFLEYIRQGYSVIEITHLFANEIYDMEVLAIAGMRDAEDEEKESNQ